MITIFVEHIMKFIVALLTLIFSLSLHAVSVNKLVVFGDSLSDNGNLYEYLDHQLPVSPPYYEGRFSNGPIWVERLTAMYYPNQPAYLQDFAFGGAGVNLDPRDDDDEDGLFSLGREINAYLLAHQDKADPRALYIIWVGSNNYLALPEDTQTLAQDVVASIQRSLELLVAKGAEQIMVVNLPDLGSTPAASDFELTAELRALSDDHNALLHNMMGSMKSKYPDVTWVDLNVNAMLKEWINNASLYGFTNVTGTCYEAALEPDVKKKSILKMVASIQKAYAKTKACDGYLFFDPLHPSTATHILMAEGAKRALDEAGVTFIA